jgi:hypothetical protein
MRDLNYQLKLLCRHSHEGSFKTRAGRERQLTAIGRNRVKCLAVREQGWGRFSDCCDLAAITLIQRKASYRQVVTNYSSGFCFG